MLRQGKRPVCVCVIRGLSLECDKPGGGSLQSDKCFFTELQREEVLE